MAHLCEEMVKRLNVSVIMMVVGIVGMMFILGCINPNKTSEHSSGTLIPNKTEQEMVRFSDKISVWKLPVISGLSGTSIPNLAGLHRCIAVVFVNKPERLAPAEIGFLRKSLGWSKADFARKLHVRPEQVSRWESSKSPVPMQVQSELLLRSLVAMGQKIEDYKDHMEELAFKEAAKAPIFSMSYDENGWHKLAA